MLITRKMKAFKWKKTSEMHVKLGEAEDGVVKTNKRSEG